MHTDDRHPVELLAEEFSERLRRGESPSIDEYVVRLPEHAELLRQVLAPIDAMERAGNAELSQRQFDSQTHRLARIHPQLGDFRIVRQVGRGGMGVVYEAVQQSLNRRVALKVLAPSIASSPDEFRRFRLEATAVAQLHHTNIVPIYGVGQADGLHFYAMQFIDGITLAEALARLKRLRTAGRWERERTLREISTDFENEPATHSASSDAAHAASSGSLPESSAIDPGVVSSTGFVWDHCELAQAFARPGQYVRAVARVGQALADALVHAHQQGIIHRDIKPGNLLLDQQGVWLTDFGVAKLSNEATQTRTGSLLGTLRYMAPEQFTGQADARSDIYSLGLTLLELLTFKPVFSDLTQARLIQAKTVGAGAVSTAELRGCPRDLATIVLKACATDPTARYATACELAEDLQRFLDDRAILARRASPLERLVRWGRRNPSVAGLTATVAASLLVLASVFAFGNYRLNIALADLRVAKQVVDENVQAKTNALEVAEEQRRLAAGNLALAIEAFEEIMQNVGGRGGAESLSIELNDGEVAYGSGVVSEADAEVLRTLLRFFERFSTENATDLSAATAAANRRTGDVLARLGRPDDAEVAYRQALEHYAQLTSTVTALDAAGEAATDAATEEHILLERLSLYNALAECAASRGDVDQALDHYRGLFELYEHAPLAARLDAAHFEYARALNAKNGLIVRMSLNPIRLWSRDGLGSLAQEAALRTANNIRESAGDRGLRRMAAGLANAARQIHRDARKNNVLAIELLSDLAKRHPGRVDYALELAHAYREQARLARNDLDQASAAEAFRNAVALLEQLLEQHPNAPYLQFVYADAVTTLAPAQARRAGIPFNRSIFSRAVQIANSLARDYPQVPDYVALKAKTLLVRNDPAPILQAIELMQGLVDEYPSLLHYRLLLANAWQRLATVRNDADDVAGARQALLQAIDVLSIEEQSAAESDTAADFPTAATPDRQVPWMIGLNVERLRQQLKSLEGK